MLEYPELDIIGEYLSRFWKIWLDRQSSVHLATLEGERLREMIVVTKVSLQEMHLEVSYYHEDSYDVFQWIFQGSLASGWKDVSSAQKRVHLDAEAQDDAFLMCEPFPDPVEALCMLEQHHAWLRRPRRQMHELLAGESQFEASALGIDISEFSGS